MTTTKKRTRRRRASIRARAGARGVRVHGTVRGASGGAVRIVVERRHSRRWATVRRARASVSRAGSYARRLARLSRGRYRVRALYLGQAAASSGYLGFRIRP